MKLFQLSRSDRLLLGILLPLAVLGTLVAWLALPPKKEGSWIRQPSTFFNTGSGAKAVFLALDQLGYQVTRLRRPISPATLEGLDALAMLEPVMGLEKDERRALGDWVKGGHNLLVAPNSRPLALLPGGTHWFFDNWFNFTPPQSATAKDSDLVTARRGESLNANDPLSAGISELVTRAEVRFTSGSILKGPLVGSSVDEIWEDDFGLVAVRVHYGSGKIIALADTYWLSNRGIREADNALFLANLASELTGGNRRGKIAFDEIHHGFPQGDDPWVAIAKLMLAEHWGWGVVQAALVAVLALYAAGVRFGRPRDIVVKQRRQHGEFAEAAGRTLYDAGANALVYRTLYQHHRTRLAKLLHLRPDADTTELTAAVAAQRGPSIAGILSEADEKLRQGRVSRLEVLELTSQLHRVLEEFEHAS